MWVFRIATLFIKWADAKHHLGANHESSAMAIEEGRTGHDYIDVRRSLPTGYPAR